MLKEGYKAYNIDIGFDNFQGFWRWDCDIKKGEKMSKFKEYLEAAVKKKIQS